MTTIHPHWQSTDDEVKPVRITVSAKGTSQPAETPQYASRRPAAIAGIALTVAIGFGIIGGASGLLGQAGQTQGDIVITLSGTGAAPTEITVRPGMKITWKNADDIPHILSSETLKTEEFDPFETSAIFPASSLTVTIKSSTTAGAHEYLSLTGEHIVGMILVEKSGTQGSATSTRPASASQASQALLVPQASSAPINQIPSSIAPLPPQTQPTNTPPANGQALPRNPHTVGTPPVAGPFNGQATGGIPAAAYHKPTQNAETGPALWIAGASSIALFWLVTRRYFQH